MTTDEFWTLVLSPENMNAEGYAAFRRGLPRTSTDPNWIAGYDAAARDAMDAAAVDRVEVKQ